MTIRRYAFMSDTLVDVTNSPALQMDSDVEICQTNHRHPSITSGQHTNGPAAIWIRKPGGEWENTGETQMHKVRARLLAAVGLQKGPTDAE